MIINLNSLNQGGGGSGAPDPSLVQYISGKTYSINSASTNEQYPSAKAVYDAIEDIQVEDAPYASLKKMKMLLHEATYDTLDYDYAKQYFLTQEPTMSIGGCSAYVKAGFFGRNYDWLEPLKDNIDGSQPDFIVSTPSTDKLQKVIGIASVPGMTEAMAAEHQQTDLWKILPFYLQDGFNGSLYACVNVVPAGEKGTAHASTPYISEEDKICAIMLVRYVLDHFTNAAEACQYLADYVTVYFPQSLLDMGYELHFLIGDETKPYVLECINGRLVYNVNEIMTNFFADGVDFEAHHGNVYTNEDAVRGDYPTSQGITPHGAGLERYNYLHEAGGSITTLADMRNVMNDVLFSKAYNLSTTPFWYSDYVSGSVTVDTFPDNPDMQALIQAAQEIKEGLREGRLWMTTHSVIYNLANGEMNIVSFENTDDEITYNRQGGGGSGATYTAGDYIDINQNNVISVTGMPTQVSELTNDAGYITLDDIASKADATALTEHVNDAVVHVTQGDKNIWNTVINKADASSVYDKIEADDKFALKSEKEREITSASTNSNYPSSKAVYDFAVHSNVDEAGTGTSVFNMVTLTEQEYNSLAVKNPNTLYFVQNQKTEVSVSLTNISNYDITVGMEYVGRNILKIEYKTDAEGAEWKPLEDFYGTSINLQPNQTAFFRGMNPSSFSDGFDQVRFQVNGSDSCVAVGGNVMALVNYNTLPLDIPSEHYFDGLFKDMYGKLATVSKDFLPATGLTNACYHEMFSNCSSLTTAPDLPATTLAEECYYSMFEDCSNLNYIKCLATNPDSFNHTESWMRNVSPNGTFVKTQGVYWEDGESGIPFGWTVEEV